VLPVLLPAFAGSIPEAELIEPLDGILLTGSYSNVEPHRYGRERQKAEDLNDPHRDETVLGLIPAAIAAAVPVFGICRGFQEMNVAFGGTLYQDLPTQCGPHSTHLSECAYETNFHPVQIEPGGWLGDLYSPAQALRVNSIHHQAVKDLAPGMRVEARCPSDGIIEAISRPGDTFVAGVQWHPEFHPVGEPGVFDDGPLLHSFLGACRQKAKQL